MRKRGFAASFFLRFLTQKGLRSSKRVKIGATHPGFLENKTCISFEQFVYCFCKNSGGDYYEIERQQDDK